MLFFEGDKYACAPCIKGHRTSKCGHTNKMLIQVRSRGRPGSHDVRTVLVVDENNVVPSSKTQTSETKNVSMDIIEPCVAVEANLVENWLELLDRSDNKSKGSGRFIPLSKSSRKGAASSPPPEGCIEVILETDWVARNKSLHRRGSGHSLELFPVGTSPMEYTSVSMPVKKSCCGSKPTYEAVPKVETAQPQMETPQKPYCSPMSSDSGASLFKSFVSTVNSGMSNDVMEPNKLSLLLDDLLVKYPLTTEMTEVPDVFLRQECTGCKDDFCIVHSSRNQLLAYIETAVVERSCCKKITYGFKIPSTICRAVFAVQKTTFQPQKFGIFKVECSCATDNCVCGNCLKHNKLSEVISKYQIDAEGNVEWNDRVIPFNIWQRYIPSSGIIPTREYLSEIFQQCYEKNFMLLPVKEISQTYTFGIQDFETLLQADCSCDPLDCRCFNCLVHH